MHAWSPVEANYLEITNEVISSPLRRAHAQVKIRNPHLRSARVRVAFGGRGCDCITLQLERFFHHQMWMSHPILLNAPCHVFTA